jgi:hypothetical protein
MVSFEIFVKAMPPSLLELKVLPSFCFAFKIPDDVAASNVYVCSTVCSRLELGFLPGVTLESGGAAARWRWRQRRQRLKLRLRSTKTAHWPDAVRVCS